MLLVIDVYNLDFLKANGKYLDLWQPKDVGDLRGKGEKYDHNLSFDGYR